MEVIIHVIISCFFFFVSCFGLGRCVSPHLSEEEKYWSLFQGLFFFMLLLVFISDAVMTVPSIICYVIVCMCGLYIGYTMDDNDSSGGSASLEGMQSPLYQA